MNAYVVLARKWRPAQFSDIVGQASVVRTLSNAIQQGRVHQAYLFTGSRGIGKTSIARIFAKALRCEKFEGTTGRSCGECSNCHEIAAGSSVDVIEIDGASNNGVDAIREIRENAKYLPASGARKIYIIDEVHMLTTAAFNALLKTLEEPPAHVLFIFATTEPHKIPATILSRCQRFDFKRVTPAQIQTRVEEILKAEGVEAESAALGLIATAAEGSMRDALSLLDQVIAYSGKMITVDTTRQSIGLIERQTLVSILKGIFERNPSAALLGVDQAYQQGHDLRVLAKSLIEILHSVILIKVGARTTESEAGGAELRALSELRTLEELEMIFQVIHHGLEWIAYSSQQKIVLDILLIKCASAEALVYLDQTAEQGSESQSSHSAPPLATPVAALAAPERPTPVGAPTATPAAIAAPPAAVQPPIAAPPQNVAPKTWEGFIQFVRRSRPLLASLMEHAQDIELPHAAGPNAPTGAQAHSTEISFIKLSFNPKDTYKHEQLSARVYLEQLHSLSEAYFGYRVKVELVISDSGNESLAARRERMRNEKETAARQAVENHPILKEARALFGGEMDPIELTGE